jgi:hypothetical protein
MKEIKYIILCLVPVPDPYLINYGSGSDFLTSYSSGSGSGSKSQKVTVPTVPVPVPVPQHCFRLITDPLKVEKKNPQKEEKNL